ncbi:hypothetical protein ABIB62_001537 [Mucilaginibacter sp. UYP25]|uniref:hypothetical protein n=1 Tax=Mucilaginibacter sp. UYP25 TaxID=3156349 RepID=UPI00339A4B2B
MIKLSTDNLVFYKIIFSSLGVVVHIFLIVGIININFWPFSIAYLVIALLQFLVGGIWRYPLLEDVYYNQNDEILIVEPLYKAKFEVRIADILKIKARFGLTNLSYSVDGVKKTVYFKSNSNENLKLIKFNK